jgi:hypothetical protein
MPQVALHKFGARIYMDADDFLQAMLSRASNPTPRSTSSSIDTSVAFILRAGVVAQHVQPTPHTLKCIPLKMRMATQMVILKRPGELLTQVVYDMCQTCNDKNEVWLLANGLVALHQHLFDISMLEGMSQEGYFGHVECALLVHLTPMLLSR